MAQNDWDEQYFKLITKMTNEGINISTSEEEYRALSLVIVYPVTTGFPLLTSRKVDFDQIKEEVKTIIDTLKEKTNANSKLDIICNGLTNEEYFIGVETGFKNYSMQFMRINKALNLTVNVYNNTLDSFPEDLAKFTLLAQVFAKTTILNLDTIRINYNTTDCTREVLTDLISLPNKETFTLPTVTMKKGISVYSYEPSDITLKSYKYSE